MPWEWSKVDERGLARFVLPEAIRLVELPVNRFDIALESEGRRHLAEAIYCALAGSCIRYAAEGYHPSDAIQLVRKPGEILGSPREGTCLDLASLFCGVCLGNELLPLLIVVEGHALAAVSLTHGLRDWNALDRQERELFELAPLTDADRLRELIDQGSYLAVECTGFAQSGVLPSTVPEGKGRDATGLLSFERAAAAGREQLDRVERPLRFVLDVAVAHYRWRMEPDESHVPGQGISIGGTSGEACDVSYYPIQLKALLREVFAPLLDDRTSLFAGREEILASLADFIRSPDGGYLVVTSAAGFGKTALMANLIKRTPEAFAYHFFTPLYGGDSVTEEFFLRNVVQQIAQWHGHAQVLPDSVHELRALYHTFLDEPLDRTRVLIIDGLDEVTTWELRPYLSRRLPARFNIIVTVRDVGQDWGAIYGMPPHQTKHLILGGLKRSEVERILRAAGPGAAALADNPAALDEIVRISANQADASLGSDPFYVRLLAEDAAEHRLSADQLAGQPQGLESYLDQWWGEIKKLAGDGPARDLFGSLTVCFGPMRRADLEAVNPSLVDDWEQNFFEDVLSRVRRFVVGDETRGYALAHPRLRQHMRKRLKTGVYRDRLLAWCAQWRSHKSPYALAHYAEHLKATGRAKDLYSLVLDPDFRAAQREMLARPQATLGDLRMALSVALSSDHLSKVLACAGAYRETVRSGSLTTDVFKHIDKRDPREALSRAELLCHAGPWSGVLFCYLAWEAALAGDKRNARKAAEIAKRVPPTHTYPLCDALLTHSARLMADVFSDASDPGIWLGLFGRGPEAGELMKTYGPSPAVDPRDRPALIASLDQRLTLLHQQIQEGFPEESAEEFFGDEERTGRYAMELGGLLRRLAADVFDRDRIDTALGLVVSNPYPRYRDIALLAISIAVLAVPDPAWVRQRLRRILRVVMESEGVTFTFDLPAVLLAECERRGLPAPALATYLAKARATNDRWGTRARERSARAGALFRQGQTAQAAGTILEAESLTSGFSGYAAVACLALASRCWEIGDPETHVAALVKAAGDYALSVRDPKFRVERVRLVDAYRSWQARGIPKPDRGLAEVQGMPDDDIRNALINYASARWSWPPDAPEWQALKALVPLVLLDGTTLDSLVARVVGLRLRSLTDQDLEEAVAVCASKLATGRPWELGQWSSDALAQVF